MTFARCVALSLALLAMTPCRAADLTLLVAFPPGQGPSIASTPDISSLAGTRLGAEPTFEDAGRFFGERFGAFVAGSPNIAMKLAPGAAGLLAARRMLADPSAEGATLGLLGPSAVLEPLVEPRVAPWSPSAFQWIGALRDDEDICAARVDAARPGSGLFGQDVSFAATLAPGSRSYIYARALNELAGQRLKIVSGYAGEFEIARALETGEANVWCGGTLASLEQRYPDLIRENRLRPVLRFSTRPAGEGLPLPRADELAATDADRDAMIAVESQTRFGAFAFAVSPSTNPARVAELRAAFLAMARDPATRRLGAARGLDVDPVAGEELQALAGRLALLSPEARERLRVALRGR